MGQFDHATFLQAVQNAGYSEQQFIEEVRQDITREQLTQAVEADFAIPPGYAQALFLYINEKRAADYVILTPEAAGDVPAPSDAVLAAYVKANPGRFSTPEYRDADYAAITPDEIAGMVREVARTPVDAILILCTNLAGSSIAEPLGRELGVPVLDSVRVAVEHSLMLLSEGGGDQVS